MSSNLVCACHIGVVQSIWLIIDLLKFEFRHIPFFIWIRYLNVKLLSTPWNVNIKLICQIYNLHPQAPFLSSKVDLNVLLPSCVIYPGLSLISFIPINRGEIRLKRLKIQIYYEKYFLENSCKSKFPQGFTLSIIQEEFLQNIL